jgi:hypothetical protein
VRGRQLARALVDAALPTAAPTLRAAAFDDAAVAAELADLGASLREAHAGDSRG